MDGKKDLAPFAEFIGVFFFLSVILNTNFNDKIGAVGIVAALLGAIYLVQHLSGGHLNPAVSLSMLLTNAITTDTFWQYIIAQFLGAGLAAGVYIDVSKQIKHHK